jgi:deoxycytidylate deaminase
MVVRLHPKYGLNATISTCIICGKEKNEIVLLGSAYKEQAPMHMVVSVEPCDNCKEKYLKEGILLVETDDGKTPSNGNLAVIKVEAFKEIFSVEVPVHHIAFVKTGILTELGILNGK